MQSAHMSESFIALLFALQLHHHLCDLRIHVTSQGHATRLTCGQQPVMAATMHSRREK